MDFIGVLTRPENLIAAQRIGKSLSRLKNIRLSVIHLRKGISGGNQKFGGFKSGVWATLLEFAYHTIDVHDTMQEVVGIERLEIARRVHEIMDVSHLRRIGKMVHDVVDLDASIDQHRTIIKRGVNEQLDQTKNIYDGMDSLLSNAALDIAQSIPLELEVDLNVIYFPQLGFHITVPLNDLGAPLYDGGPQKWSRQFTTKERVYFKDAKMHEMDSQLGDLYATICDIEIDLSYDLAQRVLENESLLVAVSDLCGELDSLLALAHGASQYKLTRPRMTDENVINISGGRHILQEMTIASFVTNDTYLVGGSSEDRAQSRTNVPPSNHFDDDGAEDGPSMLLLTGPNYSGKSVYSKQVALTVFMAHVGSFVPADSATIGLTDKILTRISTCETVSKIQSAFMIDLQQIALAINHATRRSLIIIDEFGKGTDSCDGAGLAAGVLQYFLSLGENSPKVIAATHFHEIFEHGYIVPQPRLKFLHMEVRVDRSKSSGSSIASHGLNTEVTYLYNLRPGRSTLSYGAQCALMNGIPGSIVERANKIAECSVQGEDLVAVCSAMDPEEAQGLKDAEQIARDFSALEYRC